MGFNFDREERFLYEKIVKLEKKSCCNSVLSFTNFASFPITGNQNTIYLDKSNGNAYLWDGVVYQLLNSSPLTTNLPFNVVVPITSFSYLISSATHGKTSASGVNVYKPDGHQVEVDVVKVGLNFTINSNIDLINHTIIIY